MKIYFKREKLVVMRMKKILAPRQMMKKMMKKILVVLQMMRKKMKNLQEKNKNQKIEENQSI